MVFLKYRLYSLLFLFVAFLTLFLVQSTIDQRYKKGGHLETIILPSPDFVKAVSVGHVNLAADFYWLQLIQYFGYHHQTDGRYPYFFPISQLITSLDPKFSFVYYFSAFILSYDLQQPELALQYLEKGIQHNPEDWLLYNQAGFVSYFYLKNSLLAADFYEKGGRITGAPSQYLDIARSLRDKGLERQSAKLIWRNQYINARDPITKRRAEVALIRLQMTEDLDKINRVLYQYHQRQGKYPESLQQLVMEGFLAAIPKDPLGRTYLYDAEIGMVKGLPVELNPEEKSQ